MKGFIKKTLAAFTLAGGLAVFAGCHGGPTRQENYQRCVDPCWPERYSAMARGSVNHAFGAQVNNGHVQDQTIRIEHFEPGTAVLTPGGMEHLNYLSRRRPQPDAHVFVQTAYDIPYNPQNPDAFAQNRNDLNAKRVQSVQAYLHVQTADRPVPWNVTVHDPSPVGMGAAGMVQSIQQRATNYQGVLPSSFGGGAAGATAGTGN